VNVQAMKHLRRFNEAGRRAATPIALMTMLAQPGLQPTRSVTTSTMRHPTAYLFDGGFHCT